MVGVLSRHNSRIHGTVSRRSFQYVWAEARRVLFEGRGRRWDCRSSDVGPVGECGSAVERELRPPGIREVDSNVRVKQMLRRLGRIVRFSRGVGLSSIMIIFMRRRMEVGRWRMVGRWPEGQYRVIGLERRKDLSSVCRVLLRRRRGSRGVSGEWASRVMVMR